MYEMLLEKYDDILSSNSSCNTHSYKCSPHYVIPRCVLHNPELIDCGEYLVIGNKGSAKGLIPVSLKSPQEYLASCIDVIHVYGGVYDIDRPFAKVLESMGYKTMFRPWGALDFVYSTSNILSLPGKRYESIRRNFKKLEKMGVVVSELSSDQYDEINDLEARWAQDKIDKGMRVGNIGYAAEFLKRFDSYPESMRARAVGTYLDGELIGASLGARLSNNVWVCGYEYGDKSFPSIITWGLRELSKHYEDVEFVNDGDAGAANSNIYKMKRRLTDPNSLPKQCERYIVTK